MSVTQSSPRDHCAFTRLCADPPRREELGGKKRVRLVCQGELGDQGHGEGDSVRVPGSVNSGEHITRELGESAMTDR